MEPSSTVVKSTAREQNTSCSNNHNLNETTINTIETDDCSLGTIKKSNVTFVVRKKQQKTMYFPSNTNDSNNALHEMQLQLNTVNAETSSSDVAVDVLLGTFMENTRNDILTFLNVVVQVAPTNGKQLDPFKNCLNLLLSNVNNDQQNRIGSSMFFTYMVWIGNNFEHLLVRNFNEPAQLNEAVVPLTYEHMVNEVVTSGGSITNEEDTSIMSGISAGTDAVSSLSSGTAAAADVWNDLLSKFTNDAFRSIIRHLMEASFPLAPTNEYFLYQHKVSLSNLLLFVYNDKQQNANEGMNFHLNSFNEWMSNYYDVARNVNEPTQSATSSMDISPQMMDTSSTSNNA